MTANTKIVIVLDKALLDWQKANVTAFIAGGLSGCYPEIVGDQYQDGSGNLYSPLIRQPVLVYGADKAELSRTHKRGITRNIRFALYTRELFDTNNDIDNRSSVKGFVADDLNLVGLGFYSDSKIVDKIVNGLKLLAT